MNDNTTIAMWLIRTMSQKQMTATAWARAAGVAPSTVTRFIRDQRFTLTIPTLRALAQAAGVPMPAGIADRPDQRVVPMFASEKALRAHDAARSLATINPLASFAVQITGEGLPTIGIRPGDILFCSEPGEIAAGQVVVLARNDQLEAAIWSAGGTFGHSGPLDGEIVGVAVELFRSLIP